MYDEFRHETKSPDHAEGVIVPLSPRRRGQTRQRSCRRSASAGRAQTGFDLTEDGVALRLQPRQSVTAMNSVFHATAQNRWHQWDGARWKPERTRLA